MLKNSVVSINQSTNQPASQPTNQPTNQRNKQFFYIFSKGNIVPTLCDCIRLYNVSRWSDQARPVPTVTPHPRCWVCRGWKLHPAVKWRWRLSRWVTMVSWRTCNQNRSRFKFRYSWTLMNQTPVTWIVRYFTLIFPVPSYFNSKITQLTKFKHPDFSVFWIKTLVCNMYGREKFIRRYILSIASFILKKNTNVCYGNSQWMIQFKMILIVPVFVNEKARVKKIMSRVFIFFYGLKLSGQM